MPRLSATEEIERIYDRAVRTAQLTIEKAILEASSYTRPSECIESQQLRLAWLRRLKETLKEATLPLSGEM